MKVHRSILLTTVASILLASPAAPAQSTLGGTPIVYNGNPMYLNLLWNPIDGFTMQTGNESGIYFMVGGPGFGPFPPSPAQIASETGNPNGLTTAGEVAFGTVLDSGSQFSNYTYYNPGNNETASYFGMDYSLGGGNYNFGWVEYSTSADSSVITLQRAYMDTTPNEPVTVGEATPTPEPSTMALAGLGGLSLLFYGRRK